MFTFLYPDLEIMVDLNSIKEVKEFVREMHEKHTIGLQDLLGIGKVLKFWI